MQCSKELPNRTETRNGIVEADRIHGGDGDSDESCCRRCVYHTCIMSCEMMNAQKMIDHYYVGYIVILFFASVPKSRRDLSHRCALLASLPYLLG
jgi:hypothetical protein